MGVRRRLTRRAARRSSTPPTTSQEAERYADRVLVLADGELLFAGSPRELERAPAPATAGPRGRVRRASCASGATEGALMRWLLLKDLQILRRSPLLVALLVIYPIADRDADRPRALARAREAGGGLPQPGARRARAPSTSAARSIDVSKYAKRALQGRSTRSACTTRAEAIEKVRSGEALAALIIPPTSPTSSPAGLEQPTRGGRSTTSRTRSRRASSSRRSSRSSPTPTPALSAGVTQDRGQLPRRSCSRAASSASSARTSTSSASSARKRSSRSTSATTLPPARRSSAALEQVTASPRWRSTTSTSPTRCCARSPRR